MTRPILREPTDKILFEQTIEGSDCFIVLHGHNGSLPNLFSAYLFFDTQTNIDLLTSSLFCCEKVRVRKAENNIIELRLDLVHLNIADDRVIEGLKTYMGYQLRRMLFAKANTNKHGEMLKTATSWEERQKVLRDFSLFVVQNCIDQELLGVCLGKSL